MHSRCTHARRAHGAPARRRSALALLAALSLACPQPGHEAGSGGHGSAGGASDADPSSPGNPSSQGPISGGGGKPSSARDDRSPSRAPVHGYEVVAKHPHDALAYTQGLFVQDGVLFESTGRYGTSSVRIVDLATGEVQRRTDIDQRYFAEGIAPYKGLLVLLTWRERTALVYDRTRLTEQYRYAYEGEGWGLTFDGERFWMSDGTHELRVIDPSGFKELRRIEVTDGGERIGKLNELEWIDGELWANVWQTDRIARIDPETGRVKSWVDLRGILGTHRVKDPTDDVLNGIAWDAAKKALYVTGKHWPWLFEIRVVERPS